ncbi:hypothetical protein PPYR_06041 [Photinus pyralis]|uniref:Endonuclease-reverse transcriptase n=1 Tax=Photinus pyralis TaxID=7054 RepID=A0A5N4ASJ6_PHOPY|nr:hypothetical protein PPYR_06041 [Photinus pyralis]
MTIDTSELCKIFDNFKRELKEEMEHIIRKEIHTLNIPAYIEGSNNRFKLLKSENRALKQTVNQQQKLIEQIRRQNNVVIFGMRESDENYDTLETGVIDLFNNVSQTKITRDNLNYIRRVGQKSTKIRPTIVSFTSNICKAMVLRNAFKLKGSKVYISEDYDKEAQEQRKELLAMQAKLKRAGQECKIRRNGLLINGKFWHVSEIVASEKYREGETAEDAENFAGELEKVKKRKRITGEEAKKSGSSTSNITDFFRPRTNSGSSTKSIKL